MKKLMVVLAAVCTVSTSAIASEIVIPVKAASETNIRIHIPGQTFSPESSLSTNWAQCTPWPQNPWDIRC